MQPCFLRLLNLPPVNISSGTTKTQKEPRSVARRKSSLKFFHNPGQEPPHQADALGALVVAGDGDVDELGGGVHVGERHNWDVGIGGLSDGLVVAPRIID